MWVFLPVAGVSTSVLAVVGLGAAVGFLSGLLGVGGGFLLTPLMMMLGIPATVAAASGTNAIIATSASGTAAHFRLGNVDLKIGVVLLLGGLVGAEVGVEVIRALRRLGNADLLIAVTYIVVLALVGGGMMVDSIRKLRGGPAVSKPHRSGRFGAFLKKLPWQMDFPRSRVRHSVLVPFFLCSLVGILAAIMGVGGGFIMVPMMVYLLRMPPHVAVGTDLFQIFFTCTGVTILQAIRNQTVDVMLALLIGLGSAVGAQAGARVSKLLRGEQLLILLASLALLVMFRMLISIVLPPVNLLSLGE